MSAKSAINFKLGTDNTLLRTGLQQAEHQVESFKETAHDMLLGLFAGVGVEQLIERFTEIKKQAETFQTTTDAIQRVQEAADHFDVSLDTVARTMAKLRAGDGLEKLGLDAEKFAHAGMDDQLLQIVASLEQIEDPQQRISKALEVFGPRLREILPLLNQGSAAIKAAMDNAAIVSKGSVDNIDVVEKTLKHSRNTITAWGAEALGFIFKLTKTVGTALGMLGAEGVAIFSGLWQSADAVFHGDFKGASVAMRSMRETLISESRDTLKQLGDVWSGRDVEGETPEGRWAETEEKDGEGHEKAAKERAPLADRLRDIEEEHAAKQLDTATRLKQLAQERTELELSLFALGDDESEKRGAMEDKLVANAKERLELQDKSREQAKKVAEEAAKEKEKEKQTAERTRETQGRDYFRRAEEQLGFASGKDSRTDYEKGGQHLAGVNYQVINSEAERGIRLQQESRNFLQKIAEKEWTVESPDAQ